jgi:lipid-A-disaccharide synthase
MARYLDAMLCLFPFEVPLYSASGLPALCVGHPLVEELAGPPAFSAREENLMGLFPGSRVREVHKLFPVMLEAARRMRISHPELKFCAAAARPELARWMEDQTGTAGIEIEINTGAARDLMRRAAFAWVCSGTATLEAALLGLPHAIVYRTSWLTYEVGRRLVKVNHLGMVNILAQREVAPEFIQDDCSAFALADCALRYLNEPPARAALSSDLLGVTSSLGTPTGEDGPSRQAARAVLRVLAGLPLNSPAGP